MKTPTEKMVTALTGALAVAHRGERFLSSLYTQVMPLVLNKVQDPALAEEIGLKVVEKHLGNPMVRLDQTIMERTLPSGRVLNTVEVTAINVDRVRLSDKPTIHNVDQGIYTETQVNAMNYFSGMKLSLNPTMLSLFSVTVFSRFHCVGNKLPEEGGGYKFAFVLEDLKAHLKTNKPEDEIFTSYKSQKGRLYPEGRVNYYLAGPIRGTYEWAQELPLTNRNHRRAARHYLVSELGITKSNYQEVLADMDEIIHIGRTEIDPTTNKMVKGRPATTLACENFMAKWNISYKKFGMFCAGALEMRRIIESKTTKMIYWLDATSDGPMRISALTGCKRLAHYCNIQGSKKKESLWLRLAEYAYKVCPDQDRLAPFFCEQNADGVWVPSKSVAKGPGTPMSYGAGRRSVALSMMLANPDSIEDLGILDENGDQIPGRVEELVSKSPEVFNLDTLDFFHAAGLASMVENANTVAECYSKALRRVSPLMLAFIKTLRLAFNKAAERGQPLTWLLPNGDEVLVSTWTLDDGPTDQKTFHLPDGKVVRARTRKLVRSKRASAASPLVIQAEDGHHICLEGLEAMAEGQEMIPLHDARGIRPSDILGTRKRFKRVFYRLYFKGDNRLVKFLEAMGIPASEMWGKAGAPTQLDLQLFKASKNFLA